LAAGRSDRESRGPSRVLAGLVELVEVDGGVGSDLRAGPREASSALGAVHVLEHIGDDVHVVVGAAHQVDGEVFPRVGGVEGPRKRALLALPKDLVRPRRRRRHGTIRHPEGRKPDQCNHLEHGYNEGVKGSVLMCRVGNFC